MKEFSENEIIELLEKRGREARSVSGGISLSLDEKSACRSVLISHVQKYPAHTPFLEQIRERKNSFSKNVAHAIRMAVAVTLAALLGGSVSFAAEGALPGDLLYPVKTAVNEELASLLAVSNESEAKLQAELAARRIEEAEKLAEQGRLDLETRASIAEKFHAHAEKSESNAKIVEASENLSAAAGIRSDFESVLQAHTKVLAEIDAKTPEGKAEMNAILDDVRAKLESITDARASVEAKITALNGEMAVKAAEIERANARNRIEDAKKYFEAEKTGLSLDAQTEALSGIAAADGAFAEAEVHYGVSAHANAFSIYKKAIREAEGAKLLMRAAQEFNIKIRINGLDLNASSTGNGVHASSSKEVGVEQKNGTTTIIKSESEDGNAKVKVEISSDGVKVNSSATATSSGGSSASVKVNQQIKVNSNSTVRVEY